MNFRQSKILIWWIFWISLGVLVGIYSVPCYFNVESFLEARRKESGIKKSLKIKEENERAKQIVGCDGDDFHTFDMISEIGTVAVCRYPFDPVKKIQKNILYYTTEDKSYGPFDPHKIKFGYYAIYHFDDQGRPVKSENFDANMKPTKIM